MIRETALFLIVALACVAVGILIAKRQAPPPDFPLVSAASPIIAPVRSAPCTIPLPAPNPMRRA